MSEHTAVKLLLKVPNWIDRTPHVGTGLAERMSVVIAKEREF